MGVRGGVCEGSWEWAMMSGTLLFKVLRADIRDLGGIEGETCVYSFNSVYKTSFKDTSVTGYNLLTYACLIPLHEND